MPALIDRRPAAVRKSFGSYFWDVFAWTGTTALVLGGISMARGLPRDTTAFEFMVLIAAAAFGVTLMFAGPFWLITRFVHRKFGERANFFLEDAQDVGGLTPRDVKGEWKRPASRGVAYWSLFALLYGGLAVAADSFMRRETLLVAIAVYAIVSLTIVAFCWLTRNR